MKTVISSAVIAAALAISASAHTIFQEMYVNGVDQGHLTGIRVPDYDGPITDVTSNDVICNGGINPYHQPISNAIITVPAGASVTAEWHHTLNGADPSDSADPVDPSHKGPVITYLAKVNNATQTDVTGLKWFKIWEDGYDPSTTWGVDRMVANKGKVTFQIPSCIPAGQYLMRHEMIALHAASSYPGAQLYMECAQLQITGGGTASPATVSFPGAYSGTDPGIKINIYQTLSSYTIPGPPVFTCGGSSGSTTTVKPTTTTTTTVKPTTTTTTTTTTTKPTTTTTTTAPTGTGAPVAQYGQCGGIGYTGSTSCASGYTCTKVNDYYYQCL